MLEKKIPPEAKKQKPFINHSSVLSHTHHWDPDSLFELWSLAELLNFPSRQVNITHFTLGAREPSKFSWHFKINSPFRLFPSSNKASIRPWLKRLYLQILAEGTGCQFYHRTGNLFLCVLCTSEFNVGIEFTNSQVRFAKQQNSVLIIS